MVSASIAYLNNEHEVAEDNADRCAIEL